MTIKALIAGLVGGIVISLALALYFTGKNYLNERDRANNLEFSQRLNDEKLKWKEEKELEISSIKASYDKVIYDNERAYQEKENDLVNQLITARQDATNKPIEFGDSLVRDIIRVDCLWSLGDNSLQGRRACDSEAANANTTSTNLSFAAITPSFLISWHDACDDFRAIGTDAGDETYTMDEWYSEYANFKPSMCDETLIALTPEASKYLSVFVNKGEDYSNRLLTHIFEQNEVIDQLIKRPGTNKD